MKFKARIARAAVVDRIHSAAIPTKSSEGIKSLVRWGGKYGIAYALLRVGALAGDHFARLCLDASLRANPYDFYDYLRAQGDLVPGRFAVVSARYGVICDLVREANRDPEVFPDPAKFNVSRANSRQNLAFSLGPHYCLGGPLARMEAEVALRQLFERFPHLAITGVPRRRPTRAIHGLANLPRCVHHRVVSPSRKLEQ